MEGCCHATLPSFYVFQASLEKNIEVCLREQSFTTQSSALLDASIRGAGRNLSVHYLIINYLSAAEALYCL